MTIKEAEAIMLKERISYWKAEREIFVDKLVELKPELNELQKFVLYGKSLLAFDRAIHALEFREKQETEGRAP